MQKLEICEIYRIYELSRSFYALCIYEIVGDIFILDPKK